MSMAATAAVEEPASAETIASERPSNTASAAHVATSRTQPSSSSGVATPARSAASAPGSSPPGLAQLSQQRRMSKTTVCLPLVRGSAAYYLGKRSDEYQTHQWTLYLRGPNQEDLSGVISKVVFTLHASFAQPMRELTEPPYCVTEKGWGEFEAQIRIVWQDPNEKSTVMRHFIKLYPVGAPHNMPQPQSDMERPVVAETYDEVVFTDPTEFFYYSLLQVSRLPHLKYEHEEHFNTFSDSDEVNQLLEAQKFLQQELSKVKHRLTVVDADMVHVDEALRQIMVEAASSPHQHRPSAASALQNRRATGTSQALQASKKAKTS